jgi:hypothetical protein
MNARRVPYEAHMSVVGYASEGSACLREAASAKASPTKHVEELRASARGGSTLSSFLKKSLLFLKMGVA